MIQADIRPGEGAWLRERWRALARGCAREGESAPGEALARRDRRRMTTFGTGRVMARVFERAREGANVSISIQVLTEEQWGRVLRLLGESPSIRSRLEVGLVTESVDGAMTSVGLPLVPRAAEDASARCTCGECAPGAWCRHAVAVACAIGARCEADPLSAFELRGMDREDLLSRVAAIGMASGGARTGTTVHTPAVADIETMRTPPIEESIERFWEVPAQTQVGDLSAHPERGQVLLRRLGRSPFPDCRFPLLGLLSTCYELFSERASGEGKEDGTGAER